MSWLMHGGIHLSLWHHNIDVTGACPFVILNIEAKSPRQLAAMAANCSAYFGNEGGARHIVHAMGRPSFVICSPGASKTTWLPQDTDITPIGLSASDIRPDAAKLTPREQYDLINVDRLWPLLRSFCEGL